MRSVGARGRQGARRSEEGRFVLNDAPRKCRPALIFRDKWRRSLRVRALTAAAYSQARTDAAALPHVRPTFSGASLWPTPSACCHGSWTRVWAPEGDGSREGDCERGHGHSEGRGGLRVRKSSEDEGEDRGDAGSTRLEKPKSAQQAGAAFSEHHQLVVRGSDVGGE